MYHRANKQLQKQIKFWRDCYLQEKESTDVSTKYAITAAYNEFIEKEDYESAKRAMNVLKSLNTQTHTDKDGGGK